MDFPSDRNDCSFDYIGVTTSHVHQEIATTLCEVAQFLPDDPYRKVMIGITLGPHHLQPENDSRLQAKLRSFPCHPRAVNLLHLWLQDVSAFDGFVRALLERSIPRLHGFQFNFLPDPKKLGTVLKDHSQGVIVIQFGREAFRKAAYAPKKLLDLAKTYDEVTDFILFDESQGEGIGLNVGPMQSCLKAFTAAREKGELSARVVIAGGLDAEEIMDPRKAKLVARYPHVSLDASARLHANGRLDPHLASQWIIQGSKLMSEQSN